MAPLETTAARGEETDEIHSGTKRIQKCHSNTLKSHRKKMAIHRTKEETKMAPQETATQPYQCPLEQVYDNGRRWHDKQKGL